MEARLEEDAVVEIALVEGQMMMTPIAAKTWTLAALLAGVTKSNLHREIETGSAAG